MVYFVGAGPGDPELITVKGLRLLREADIVVYAGSLVNADILKACKSDAEIYDSKKMNLQEVLKVFEEAEKSGKNVVRLHTGDTSLYGAIREQMDWLKENGIDYDICPGVSSFSGAAAAIRKEYTLPGVTQTVIITRAEGRTPVPEKEKLSALAAHQSTMVIFLSATLSEKVRKELIAGGYPEDTPSAVVFRATWPDEEVVWTTLEKIPEAFKREEARRADGNMKQALIIVGRAIDDKTVYEYSKLYDRDFVTCYRGKESR
ncbi:cobalt-precorrin 4 C11-methyltransferase [Oribacterium sp. KHPX15]|uniref:precorrin-4 C(11)-methyltransferase n=1 Tax=Oribacterium sp. KHPX15 TaxID=1855342 RepID=UPI00089ACDED|nr:precorrin-4 C(11)-methyltransferase [Oribacterium sp. KHPX15]SEA21910.1 cobalt-precorrin 4 C11-methyltransferase [Oribacterium sp. KHPX15]